MHELGITRNIVAIVGEAAKGRQVRRVTIEVGKLSGVMSGAIAFCFDVVAAGTTVVRALEGNVAAFGHLTPGEHATDLFIRPGFEFRVVDAMITNFHLPRSTLLMLVSAFAGRANVLRAYAQAVGHRYRFYSFGDAMLVARQRCDT